METAGCFTLIVLWLSVSWVGLQSGSVIVAFPAHSFYLHTFFILIRLQLQVYSGCFREFLNKSADKIAYDFCHYEQDKSYVLVATCN